MQHKEAAIDGGGPQEEMEAKGWLWVRSIQQGLVCFVLEGSQETG